MIEIVDPDRCIACDRCIEVCPMRVFDRGTDGIPVIARQDSCQTCFQCEAYCPTDALFVAPLVTAVAPGSRFRDVTELADSGLLGGYRRELGWGQGKDARRPRRGRTGVSGLTRAWIVAGSMPRLLYKAEDAGHRPRRTTCRTSLRCSATGDRGSQVHNLSSR
ncbi:4Fe-4S dicluster domain-containing protein [Streptomyces anandii]|uniref:4Fe-4S dicluster domain-containing protein n=1 Tax=Streptomyces anandii TaxID=285454 RepID=UPI000AC7AF9C|nr:ferredoxin family protein [Streptomyces anandii]GGY13356.1 hypothetical protein GCM10010510_69210 [Streptomyces anandii JCM 4720]